MSDIKPSVIPTQEQMALANDTGDKIAKQFEEENKQVEGHVSSNEEAAAEVMRRRTADLVAQREANIQKNQKLADELEVKREEQMKQSRSGPKYIEQPTVEQPTIVPTPMERVLPENPQTINHHDAMVRELSQPQMNQAFDLLPIPSEGKLYPTRKKALKVAYLTTSDENILTSPNLVESGEFLEILINRKLLEPEIRYKDLLPGDRNAIMIWLRATGYGETYGVQVLDRNNIPFETEIDLSTLKTVNLTVNPTDEGFFNFSAPTNGDKIKVKLLTVGEIDYIEELVATDKENGIIENKEPTYILENQIVDVNGNRDKTFIKNYIRNMRLMDAQPLREFIDSIDCGIDLRLDIEAPGGESIATFLPLNPSFFWPNAQL